MVDARFTVKVDETGNTIYADGTFVNRFQDDGSVELAVEGRSPSIRLEVLPVLPLEELTGTPTTGTPAP